MKLPRTKRRAQRRHRRRGRAGLLVGVALVLRGVLGWIHWLWIEVRLTDASQAATATVTNLYRTKVADGEAWSASRSATFRHYVTYRFRPTGANGTTVDREQTQEVGEAAYRRLVVGSSVPIRYNLSGSQAATIGRHWNGAPSSRFLSTAGVGVAILVMWVMIGLGKAERQHAWADSGESA